MCKKKEVETCGVQTDTTPIPLTTEVTSILGEFMKKSETNRLITLLQQREEMSGLGSDEAEELLVLLQKSTEHVAHWIESYPRED